MRRKRDSSRTQRATDTTRDARAFAAVQELVWAYLAAILPSESIAPARQAAPTWAWQTRPALIKLMKSALIVTRYKPETAVWLLIEPSVIEQDEQGKQRLVPLHPHIQARGAALRGLLVLGAPAAQATTWAKTAQMPVPPALLADPVVAERIAHASAMEPPTELDDVYTRFITECNLAGPVVRVLYAHRFILLDAGRDAVSEFLQS